MKGLLILAVALVAVLFACEAQAGDYGQLQLQLNGSCHAQQQVVQQFVQPQYVQQFVQPYHAQQFVVQRQFVHQPQRVIVQRQQVHRFNAPQRIIVNQRRGFFGRRSQIIVR